MIEKIQSIFFEYANLVLVIPLFLAALRLKRNPPELKIIFYYLLLSCITQIASYAFWKKSMNNFPILHAYTIIEYLLLLWYYSILLKGFIRPVVFNALFVLFPIFALADSIWFESIYTFNNYGRSLEALIFIFLNTCWFVKILAGDNETGRNGKAFNYINGGFLAYFAGSITLFAYSSSVIHLETTFRLNVWTIHTILAVQLYIFIAIGLWKAKTR